MTRLGKFCALALVLGALAGCTAEKLSIEELMDPQTCKGCHPTHFEEWQSSMHAYAAEDPVFIAMNRRGQEETNGELGDFCVKCHAPMAVRTGATEDGLNLDSVPAHLKGVTCYFCHQIDAVEGDSNGLVHLADDGVMRGPLADADDNDAHRSTYDPMFDRNRLPSSDPCGACHDIKTPAGVHLERTYAEWKQTLFSNDTIFERLTCVACHMRGRPGLAANVVGVKERRIHSHSFPAVDIALTEFPGIETQRALIQQELDNTVLAQMCVSTATSGTTSVDVILENVAAGHEFPSGAAQDRRVWVEVIAYRNREVMFSSGVVPDGTPLTGIDDPSLWRLGDRVFDENGEETHMFWDVRSVQSEVLPGQRARNMFDPRWIQTHSTRKYTFDGQPDQVTMRVRMRPVGLDLLDDLIDSGHLDPVVRDKVPTFDLQTTQLEWRFGFFPCVPN